MVPTPPKPNCAKQLIKEEKETLCYCRWSSSFAQSNGLLGGAFVLYRQEGYILRKWCWPEYRKFYRSGKRHQLKAQKRAVMVRDIHYRSVHIIFVNCIAVVRTSVHRLFRRNAEKEQCGKPQGKNRMKYAAEQDGTKLPY